MSDFKYLTSPGIESENLHWNAKQENGDFHEIARLKGDGTFIVMGREYKDIREYIMEKEGIKDWETKH